MADLVQNECTEHRGWRGDEECPHCIRVRLEQCQSQLEQVATAAEPRWRTLGLVLGAKWIIERWQSRIRELRRDINELEATIREKTRELTETMEAHQRLVEGRSAKSVGDDVRCQGEHDLVPTVVITMNAGRFRVCRRCWTGVPVTET